MEKEQEMKSEKMETQMMVMDEAAAASHAAYWKVKERTKKEHSEAKLIMVKSIRLR